MLNNMANVISNGQVIIFVTVISDSFINSFILLLRMYNLKLHYN